MDREKQFLDFLEGKLSAKEKQKFLSALENDQALATAFEQYQQLASIEGFIAQEQHTVAPTTSVNIMERIDALETKRSSMMFEKLLSKRFLFPSAALVTACVTFMVASETAKDSSYQVTSGPLIVEPMDDEAAISSESDKVHRTEAIPQAARPEEIRELPQEIKTKTGGEKANHATVAEPLADASSQDGDSSSRDLIGEFKQIEKAVKANPAKIPAPPKGEEWNSLGSTESLPVVKGQTLMVHSSGLASNSSVAKKRKPGSATVAVESENSQGTRYQDLRAHSRGNAEGRAKELAVRQDSFRGARAPSFDDLAQPTHLSRRIIAPIPPANPYAGEVYGVYQENPRLAVADQPLSTFSIDVDTGSFTNLRRYLSMGQLPPKDSVRIEELVNYFDYQYPSQGDKPFTVSYEIAPSPLETERFLMKVGVQAKQVELNSELGWNLVFLVDVSGSMNSPNKLPLLKRSLSVLVDKMRPVDRVAIVTYANSANVLLGSTTGANKEQIRQVIQSLRPGGGTNGSGGIDLAYSIAEQNKIAGSVNRVILATDGDFNVGTYSFDGLMNLIENKRKNGVSLTSLGFGVGNLQEKNLEQLADRGNGNYFYLDTFKEARRVLGEGLTGNMLTIAKDVKLQVEFNPKNVLEYRLVGYDNRKLANQDFNNDKVDAGEIGSGHTVTAIYEIVLADSEYAKSLTQQLRYQSSSKVAEKAEVSFPKELAFVKIRYKEPEGSSSKLLTYPIYRSQVKADVSETSDDFRFAAAVSYFGHLLRESKFTGNYDYKAVLELAKAARGADENGKRRELIELIANASAVNR